jgi:hypothetical protein
MADLGLASNLAKTGRQFTQQSVWRLFNKRTEFYHQLLTSGGEELEQARLLTTDSGYRALVLDVTVKANRERGAIMSATGGYDIRRTGALVNLVKKIEEENDHSKFLQLVAELNDLLDGKAQRLEHKPPLAPTT